jgi:hypothetical protein
MSGLALQQGARHTSNLKCDILPHPGIALSTGKPHEAAGIHINSWQHGRRMARSRRPQQSPTKIPVIGVLGTLNRRGRRFLSILRKAFNDLGYIEGINVP